MVHEGEENSELRRILQKTQADLEIAQKWAKLWKKKARKQRMIAQDKRVV